MFKKTYIIKFTIYIQTIFLGLIIFLLVASCRADLMSEEDFSLLREKMVTEQIEARGITDKIVLDAMRKVPRHKFVPKNARHLAYNDYPLPIGEGQTISQPYIVALMTQAIGPDKEMKVLEIGTGSGYQAAILAEVCKSVYSIEILEKLGKKAEKILLERYKNVKVKIGDGYKGWPQFAPFDAIIVTCAPTRVPAPLAEQLKEGGKMVIPVGESGDQILIVMKKNEGRLVEQAIIPVRFVPMVDTKGKVH